MSKHVRFITPVAPGRAEGLAAGVYRQMKQDFGIVPEPFLIHSPRPELLAGVWGIVRETLVAGRVRRGTKEAVAATIADLNRCPWCVDAHTSMLYATGEGRAARLILHGAGRHAPTADLRAAIDWARATRSPAAPILANPPFAALDEAEAIGTAVAFHYLTRLVSALLSETFLPGPAWVRGALRRTGGAVFSRTARKTYPPGRSAALLPAAPLPADLAWAATTPAIAGAFARFAAATEQAGAVALTPDVRCVLRRHLQGWHGEDPGLGRQWVEAAIGGLDRPARAAGRLALLAALAPHRIDEEVVRAFREQRPADADLVGALAWASFAAARRVGGWLAARPPGDRAAAARGLALPAPETARYA